MTKNIKLGIFVAVLTILAATSTAQAAQTAKTNPASSTGGNKQKSPPPTLIFNRKLVSTTLSMGNTSTTVIAGQVAIDSPLTFVCPAGGCTVTVTLEVQAGDNTTAGNEWGVCAELDNEDMPPTRGCPFLGTLPTDATYQGVSFTFAQSGVTAGKHTLQGFVYTFFGGSFDNYTITYRLYTP